MPTLIPWYRGFKGTIAPVPQSGKKKELQWKTKGCYRPDYDKHTIEIFELPIGTWTSKYKAFLDKCIMGSEDTKSTKGKRKSPKSTVPKKASDHILKDYINESSDIEVKFTLMFDAKDFNKLLGPYDKNGDNEFERKFNLTSTITCTNTLTFFDDECKLKNYRSIEEVFDAFYDKRITYYDERKKHQVRAMEEELLLMSVRARFINEIISKKVKINNVPKAEIIAQLEAGKYPKMFQNKLYTDESITSLTKEQQADANYNFLVNMSIYNLTKEKVEELNKLTDEVKDKLEKLKATTIETLWTNDLDELEVEYKKFMKSYYKSYDLNESDFIKKKSSKLDFNAL
jgi:DNA topoisomerase-2